MGGAGSPGRPRGRSDGAGPTGEGALTREPPFDFGIEPALLLLALEQQPWRFETAAPRWHARLCAEARLTLAEAPLAVSALDAMGGTGAVAGGQALAAICSAHGLDDAVGVLDRWLDARAAERRQRNT
jgi:hypothetical protein